MQNKYIPKLPRFRIWRATVTVSFPCDLPVTIIWNRQIGYGTVDTYRYCTTHPPLQPYVVGTVSKVDSTSERCQPHSLGTEKEVEVHYLLQLLD